MDRHPRASRTGDRPDTARRIAAAALLGLAWPAATRARAPGGGPGNAAARGEAVTLRLPDAPLVRDDGQVVRLADEVAAVPRVAVQFVFLGCTAVCPIGLQLFAEVQRRGGWDARGLRLLSISIDPLGDRPADLAARARRLGRLDGWHFYTGTVPAIELVQRAFGVWRPDRMDHPPATFVRPGTTAGWRRLDGFPDPRDLLAELRRPAGPRDT